MNENDNMFWDDLDDDLDLVDMVTDIDFNGAHSDNRTRSACARSPLPVTSPQGSYIVSHFFSFKFKEMFSLKHLLNIQVFLDP